MPRLLKGKHANFVSVKVDNAIFLRVHRPIAERFSQVWKRALQDQNCNVVTVTFPPDPPIAPPAGQRASNLQNAPASDQAIPPPPPPSPSHKDLLKFVIQWMEQGGADAKGRTAIKYPSRYRPGLERLLALAQMLEVDELLARVEADLGNIPVRTRYCAKCRRVA